MNRTILNTIGALIIFILLAFIVIGGIQAIFILPRILRIIGWI